MTTTEARLLATIDEFNGAQLTEFQVATGLRWLGDAGPLFLAGEVRVRGVFVDPAGGHWTDVDLVTESAYLRSPLWDHYRDLATGNLEPAYDLRLLTPERGWVDALIGPVGEICELLDLPTPELFPDGWARSWRTFPWISDAEAIGLVAAGLPGNPPFIGGGRR